MTPSDIILIGLMALLALINAGAGIGSFIKHNYIFATIFFVVSVFMMIGMFSLGMLHTQLAAIR